MKLWWTAAAVPLALVGALAMPPAVTSASEGASNYIVVLKDGSTVTPDEAATTARRLGAEVSFVYRHALRGYAAALTPTEHAVLSADPAIEYIEADGVVTTAATQFNPPWGLDRIDQRSLPLSNTYTYNSRGTGVTAYIIDTGIRASHTQFDSSTNANVSRVLPGYDAVTAGGTANDCNGHGTHVAGTVGGLTYGVAKDVFLVPVRVLDCWGSGLWSWVIAGVDFVTAAHVTGPAVANMSLVGGFNSSVNTAVTNSIADGVSYSVAAGNSTANACSYSPASVSSAITLGASDINDANAWFSNYGLCVDWYAPGVNVLSAYHFNDFSTASLSGTSMASPHNAGVAALYLEDNPTASPATVRATLAGMLTQNVVTGVPCCFTNNDLLYKGSL